MKGAQRLGGLPAAPHPRGAAARSVTDVPSGGLAGPGSLLPPPVQKAPGGSAPLKRGGPRGGCVWLGCGLQMRRGAFPLGDAPPGPCGCAPVPTTAIPAGSSHAARQAGPPRWATREVPEGDTEAGATVERRRNGSTP